jgi:predicted transposase/invertase (TIGR01784 family)
LSHPECPKAVLEISDYVGSTSGIIDYAAKSENEEFIICIEKGILRDVLVKHKAEVISMVLTSFNQKAYEEDLKNQYKEGVEEGIKEGLDLGRTQMAQEIALRLFQSGNSPEQIAQLTGIDVEVVNQWIEKAK